MTLYDAGITSQFQNSGHPQSKYDKKIILPNDSALVNKQWTID